MEETVVRWLMVPSSEDLLTVADIFGRPDWHRDAACRGEGIDNFIHGRGRGTYARAQALCAVCPVRVECLEVAMANEDLVGFWGGTSERERRRMRRDTNVTQEVEKQRVSMDNNRQGKAEAGSPFRQSPQVSKLLLSESRLQADSPSTRDFVAHRRCGIDVAVAIFPTVITVDGTGQGAPRHRPNPTRSTCNTTRVEGREPSRPTT